MDQWYTLHTKPNAEYQVAAALEQRGFYTYLPQLGIRRARKRGVRKPFFPCYLFIKVDLEIVGVSSVQWTPGLRRIVAFDDRPLPLPDEAINLIRRKLGEVEAAGGWPAHNFTPGDTVRIIEGPFQNMLAIFDGPTTPAERVQVLLNILGHYNRVELDVTALEKAPPGAKLPRPKRPRRTRGRGRRIMRTSRSSS